MKKDRIVELARKLLALAERGVGGEKENAQFMLDELLAKHGLLITDIEPKTRTRRIVKGVTKDIKQMFVNFCASIVGSNIQINKYNGVGYFAVYMNDREWQEFEMKWPIYKKTLKSEILKLRKKHQTELKAIVSAFISKHSMYADDSEEDDRDILDLTPEEIEEIIAMMQMKDKLSDINFNKQIE